MKTTLRVYYEDTDAAGVVYYANYLKFAERARTEAVRAVGIHQQALLEHDGVGFVVTEVTAEFHHPAKLDDLLTITTSIHDIGKASITLKQRILREHTEITTLTVKLAMVGRGMKPLRFTEEYTALLTQAFKD